MRGGRLLWCLGGRSSSALVSGYLATLSGGVMGMRETKYTVSVDRHGDVSQSSVFPSRSNNVSGVSLRSGKVLGLARE
jgi:hypothetical protein